MNHAVLTVRVPHRRSDEVNFYRFTGTKEHVAHVRRLVKRVNRQATVTVVEMPDVMDLIANLERAERWQRNHELLAELRENLHVLDVIASI